MPSHNTHRRIDRLVLGKEYPHIHWYKDKPFRYLGPSHRRLRHDLETDLLIGAICGPDALLSALMHDAADFGMTAARRRKAHKRVR